MYVVQGTGFHGTERLTYAHEYVHALQDQNYDLEKGLDYSDEACENDSERCAAIQALIEGDASLLEIAWLTNYATNQDLTDIRKFYNNYHSPVYDNAPAFFQEDFIFPYLNGQTFVEHLHNQGGWLAVNQAYENLPVSTEQILHPERYPDDKPISVSLPDMNVILGEAWQEVDKGVMGEWYTYLILAFGLNPQTRLSKSSAQAAAEGWGGDAYAVYYNDQDEKTVLVMRTIWETAEEATEFSTAFQQYAGKRFAPAQESSSDKIIWGSSETYSELHIEEAITTWLIAPDEATAQEVWKSLSAQ